MDLRQLRYFLKIADEGQVTSAARLLNMEQPPLSRQLKLMEEELGVTLFDRHGKRLQLTPAGERLRERAVQLLHQFQETLTEVKEMEEGLRGVLAVGAVVSCISLLPSPLHRFKAQYPLVNFKVTEGDHYLLSEQMDKREIEAAIVRLPFEASGGSSRYAVKPLPSDPFVALIPESLVPPPQAAHPVMSLSELAAHPLITLKTNRTVGMHESLMNAFSQAGLHPRILCECASVAITLTLVAGGIGAAILPKSVLAAFPLRGIRTYDLSEEALQSEVGLVWLKDRYLSRAARRFIDLFDT